MALRNVFLRRTLLRSSVSNVTNRFAGRLMSSDSSTSGGQPNPSAHSQGTPPLDKKKAMDGFQAMRRSDTAHAESHRPATTFLQVSKQRSSLTSELWSQRTSNQVGEDLPHRIVEKSLHDGYCEAWLRFSSDPVLMNEYLTFMGTIRVGKILEDLDALAGTVAYQHCDDLDPNTRPLYVVTASVDRIDLRQKLIPTRDYRLSGKVIYVGSSSMEILLTIHSPAPDTNAPMETILTALFTMVARDAKTQKAYPVNTLVAQSEEDRALMAMGQRLKSERSERRKASLELGPPSEEERLIIHDLYLKTLPFQKQALPGTKMWMEDGALRSLIICHPQDRNIHNKIFGGFLMREAFELAWATAYTISGEAPFFLALDDILFKKPVEIGSLLQLTSHIEYCPGSPSQAMIVGVTAEVLNPKTRIVEMTNRFHFAFTSPGTIPHAIPHSYSEAMEYVQGRRRFLQAKEIAKEIGFDRYY